MIPENADFVTTAPDGSQVSTGCLPRTSEFGKCCAAEPGKFVPVYEDSPDCPLVEENLWSNTEDVSWAEDHDYYQNGDPSCCLFALANIIMFFLRTTNLASIVLDARKAWIECTGGRGGYAIDDALVYAMTKGFPVVGSTDRVFITEAFDCGNVKAVFSAVMRRCFVAFGHYVPGGHAEAAVGVVVGDSQYVNVRGSWGKSAYDGKAYHLVSRANLEQGIPKFGAFAIRAVRLRPADTQNLPDAA